MTLKFDDPDYAGREIANAEDVNADRIKVSMRQLKRYVTRAFGGTYLPTFDEDDDETPENHYYEAIALGNPRMAFANPKVAVSSTRTGPQEEIAIALKHGVNQWVVINHLDEMMAEWAVDFRFPYCVAHVSMSECPLLTPDHDQVQPRWPEVNRISSRDSFRDPLAQSLREVRFIGHKYYIDKDDLLALARKENEDDEKVNQDEEDEAEDGYEDQEDGESDGPPPRKRYEGGWYIEAIEGATTSYYWGDDGGAATDSTPDREQLCVKQVWVRGWEGDDHPGPKKGFHGSTFTYICAPASGEEGDYPYIPIRDVIPFFGPPEGPYEIGGEFYVPDDPFHLASMVANDSIVCDLNDHARAMSRSARRYKRLVLVDDADTDLADKVEYEEHDMVIRVPGLDKTQVVNLEVGGVNDMWLRYFSGIAKPRADRALGTSDMMRGTTSASDPTATESALANQNSEARSAWPKSRFQKFIEGVLRKVLYYMYYEDRTVLVMGQEAATELLPKLAERMAKDIGVQPETLEPYLKNIAPVYRGGNPDPDSGSSFEDLSLSIEVMSMEHTSEAVLQHRALQGLEILIKVGQAAPAMPFIPWKWILSTIGDALNMPSLGDGFDEKIYQQFVGMEVAQRQMALLQPRLLGQVKGEGGPAPQHPMAGVSPYMQGRSTGATLSGTTGRDMGPRDVPAKVVA